mmetsp:Transcript_72013/g.172022  ORF Transcript_72013/g.172022 Transcript_72013/m.172022 type:complete len:93 (-) Transcript_72013:222-500(-)
MTRHFSAIQDTCRFMFESSVAGIGGKGSRSGDSLRSNPLVGLSFLVFAGPELTAALGDRGITRSWEELESAWLTGELAMYRISKAWGLLFGV